MSVVNKYRCFCVDEQKQVWTWNTPGAVVTCPNNASHILDLTSKTIVDTVASAEVTIREENIPTGGNFRSQGIHFDVPATESNVTQDYTFPYPIAILALFLKAEDNYAGDTLDIYVGYETIAGVTVQEVISGSSNITVSDAQYAKLGYEVSLITSDHQTKENLGEVVNVTGNTITAASSASTTYPPGSYMALHVRTVKDFEFGSSCLHTIGSSKIGATYIPTGRTVHVVYKNNNGQAKRVRGYIEYLY